MFEPFGSCNQRCFLPLQNARCTLGVHALVSGGAGERAGATKDVENIDVGDEALKGPSFWMINKLHVIRTDISISQKTRICKSAQGIAYFS